MHGNSVVDNNDVANLPRNSNLFPLHKLEDTFQSFCVDGRAVTVEYRLQGVISRVYPAFECCDHAVKEDFTLRSRDCSNRRKHACDSLKVSIRQPFPRVAHIAHLLLGFSTVVHQEGVLPRPANSTGFIIFLGHGAHILHSEFLHLAAGFRISGLKKVVHFMRKNKGCLPTFLRRHFTEKHDIARRVAYLGHFVVKRNRLARGRFVRSKYRISNDVAANSGSTNIWHVFEAKCVNNVRKVLGFFDRKAS
mmetsp:Transcript_11123/g.19579  ORF Transcript_11123/g.19579 Transcript_11123/m.19579 type:complete len:249 (-) Transcript_11123:75-821(-)